ncbi:hypothetical protein E2C01_023521 [Portunus trituberculatus]|uniref:Uncharacterized protein n=1 Tax=Portunus trituberculatus TaxID=210409 RepID=A0A5B7E854_PORTR|nr:hypothetical protein [Portunus trituberculatus]
MISSFFYRYHFLKQTLTPDLKKIIPSHAEEDNGLGTIFFQACAWPSTYFLNPSTWQIHPRPPLPIFSIKQKFKTPLATPPEPASPYWVRRLQGLTLPQMNSACRSEIRPRNSFHTYEILRWNSASTSETFIMKAPRIELTHPPKTSGANRSASFVGEASEAGATALLCHDGYRW